MNSNLALLPLAPTPSAPAALATTIAAPPAAGPFSRVLDRAVQPPAARNSPAPRESRAASARNPQANATPKPRPTTAKDDDQTERQDLPRLKNRKAGQDEADALAGAAAVAAPGNPPPPPAEVTPAAAAPDLNAAEIIVGATGENAGDDSALITAPAETVPPETQLTGPDRAWSKLPFPTASANESEIPPAATELLSAPKNSPTPAATPELVPEITPPLDAGIASANAIHSIMATGPAPEPLRAGTPTPPTVIPSVEATPVDTTTDAPNPADAMLPALTAAAGTPPPEELRRGVRAARRAREESLETIAGTGGAKTTATMKTAIKKEEVAGSAEQFLPGSPLSAMPPLRNLPGSSPRNGNAAISLDALEAAKGLAAPAHADHSGALDQPAAAHTITRVAEVVSREVRMFKRGGDDLVEVVLTPDAKTQISLRLQWRDGQVEVQARCDLGDYQSLNSQWQNLQSSLASQGVRLSHLSERVSTGFTEFFNYSSFGQNSRREAPPEHPVETAEPTPPNPAAPARSAPAAAAPRRSHRIFDFWA